jgi:hypothetical protein
MGENEADHQQAVKDWLQSDITTKALDELIVQVRSRFPQRSESTRKPCVYVASETALVRQHVADLIRHKAEGEKNAPEVDFFSFSGISHPVDIDGNNRHSPHRENSAGPSTFESEEVLKSTADLLFPYLEWWALAHSRDILVRRGSDLKPIGSTYSGTAHLYGGWPPDS